MVCQQEHDLFEYDSLKAYGSLQRGPVILLDSNTARHRTIGGLAVNLPAPTVRFP